jgi:hypothetical protein
MLGILGQILGWKRLINVLMWMEIGQKWLEIWR